jgi:hypothetical protein
MDAQTLSIGSGTCMAKTAIVTKTLHKSKHTLHQNVHRYFICFIFGRDVISSCTVVGKAYVLLLASIWQAACGDLSGYHLAKQLCKGIHKTRISCLAQSGIKWRSVCGKKSLSARHGPWQRLGFKASSMLATVRSAMDFALGCAIHAYAIPVVICRAQHIIASCVRTCRHK